MSDLIRREDALDAIELKKVYITAYTYKGSINGYVSEGDPLRQYNKGLDDAIKAVNSLAPAEPERKKGEWIEYPDCLRYDGAYSDDQIVCSECGQVFSIFDNCTEDFDFCPKCGADMRGE